MSSKPSDFLNLALAELESPTSSDEDVFKIMTEFADSLPIDFKARLFNILQSQLFISKSKEIDEVEEGKSLLADQPCCPPDDVLSMRPDFGEDIQK
eukprot:gnl/Chilomastix_caulleri/354.p1 GENE.gnl/Chilomastix_caulleri/354~~gnl/Chilomastix_caulleri/354.p1  ORF type:complete len:103 (+),score=18.88 gnl/Chilomastix_caulleri/354:23-310(+)